MVRKPLISTLLFTHRGVSPARAEHPPSSAARLALSAAAASLGSQVHHERVRRGWSLDDLAARARLSRSAAHAAESGRPASLDTYVRLATALGLKPQFELGDSRRSKPRASLEADLVHSAMGELEARQLAGWAFHVAIDEPYQHYQFAGRADVLAWDDAGHLLHIENRTRFPDMQAVAGSFNGKRSYLPAVLGDRLGIRRWHSVTHVMAALWSAEALHVIRMRHATFGALCPDGPDAFVGWWSGKPPATGISSTLVVLDPAAAGRQRPMLGLADALRVRPRYRDYAAAAAASTARSARPAARLAGAVATSAPESTQPA